jgi:hypothetical protein
LTRGRKLFLWGLFAAAAVAASLLIYQHYYRARVWPAELQRDLLGVQIAEPDALIDRDGSSAYGEGMFRWRYRVDPRDPRLRKFCPAASRWEACRFTRRRRIAEGVDVYVTYSGGVMLLEEIWS